MKKYNTMLSDDENASSEIGGKIEIEGYEVVFDKKVNLTPVELVPVNSK